MRHVAFVKILFNYETDNSWHTKRDYFILLPIKKHKALFKFAKKSEICQ